MINYIKSTEKDMDMLIESRMEMLKVVNNLPDNYKFNDDFIEASKIFFASSNQTSILAINENKKVIGCASMCYIEIMPTFSHPTGKRAHLMNVYTNARFRRQGIAKKMLEILINEAKERGVTEISLDTTETGRAFYKSCGFKESEECMVLDLNTYRFSQPTKIFL